MADSKTTPDRDVLQEHDAAAEGGRDRTGAPDFEKDNPRKQAPGNPPEQLGTKDKDKAPVESNEHAARGDKHPEGRDQGDSGDFENLRKVEHPQAEQRKPDKPNRSEGSSDYRSDAQPKDPEAKPLRQKPAGDSSSSAKRATDEITGHQRPGTHPEAVLPPEGYGRAHPVQVDGRNRRTDDDAMQGHRVEVFRGPHKGRTGAFLDVSRYDHQDGYPEEIVVRTDDHVQDGDEYVGVKYKDVRHPAARGGRK